MIQDFKVEHQQQGIMFPCDKRGYGLVPYLMVMIMSIVSMLEGISGLKRSLAQSVFENYAMDNYSK